MTPRVIVLFSSFRCDSRCIMCSAWRKQNTSGELTLDQVEHIFQSRMLSDNIEIVNLTGGEPTIRTDLARLVQILIARCRRLRRIDIPTNGINSTRVIDTIEQVLAVLLPTPVQLCVTVSVDGVGDIHDQNRGVPGAFVKIDATIKVLQELSILYPFMTLGLNATISRTNISNMALLQAYARSLSVGLNFTLAALSEIGVESISQRAEFELLDEDRAQLLRFFNGYECNRPDQKQYVGFLRHWLRTGKRNIPCNFRRGRVVLLEPNGDLFVCGNFREFKAGNLLTEPCNDVWARGRTLLHKTFAKCSTCLSNCYL
jgi:MoaA/NifB/PqqE/SkfB family radical SAM enzyme